mgnify:CR=1 FL=1
MSFTPFPDTGYFFVLNEPEHYVGAFNLAESIDLKHIQTVLFIRGALGGTEQLRLNLYGTTSISSTPIATSDWFSLSSIGGYTNNWIGNVFFDFDGAPINPNLDYFVGIESNNYTRNADTFYLAFRMNWNPSIVLGSTLTMNILGSR